MNQLNTPFVNALRSFIQTNVNNKMMPELVEQKIKSIFDNMNDAEIDDLAGEICDMLIEFTENDDVPEIIREQLKNILINVEVFTGQ